MSMMVGRILGYLYIHQMHALIFGFLEERMDPSMITSLYKVRHSWSLIILNYTNHQAQTAEVA